MAIEFKKITDTIEFFAIAFCKVSAESELGLTDETILDLTRAGIAAHCAALELHGTRQPDLDRILNQFEENKKVAMVLIRHARKRFEEEE